MIKPILPTNGAPWGLNLSERFPIKGWMVPSCSSINSYGLPGDVIGIAGAQVCRQVSQLLVPSMASQRGGFFYALDGLFLRSEPQTGAGALGRKRSGSNAIRVDSILRPLHRESAGHG